MEVSPKETAPVSENKKNDSCTNTYAGKDGADDSHMKHTCNTGGYKQPLLWVHQTDWQKQLLARYGNTISLIDATYKTTKYELALFLYVLGQMWATL